MIRQLTGHRLGSLNERLEIEVLDQPGPGGASAVYRIGDKDGAEVLALLQFQRGPTGEQGVNGISHEALLAILIDRLEGMQEGPFPCDENDAALGHCRMALAALQQRTRSRMERGVEGRNAA